MSRIMIVLSAVAVACIVASGFGGTASADCWPKEFATGERGTQSVAWITVAPSSSSTWGSADASGTSGCGEAETVRTWRARQFVTVTHERLRQDVARGDGEHLRALATLLGCAPTVHAHLGRRLQSAAGWLLTAEAESPQDLLAGIRGVIAGHPRLAAGCAVES